MDLTERIERRRNRRSADRLIVDPDPLNPAVQPTKPVGRETLVEALLDAIDPLFERAVPPNVYAWGPPGSGKSAVVTALVSALSTELSGNGAVYTATRGADNRSGVRVVYLDAQHATSRFRVYRQLLDGLRADAIPERGVSTDMLRNQIESVSAESEAILVAVDHLGDPRRIDLGSLYEFFEPFENLAWLGVGQTPPKELSFQTPEQQVHVPPYTYELVDVLTVRGSRGLSRTPDHAHVQRIAEWADGDAHDALAALYVAATNAESNDRTHIRTEDVDVGIGSVPTDGVRIGRVLTLSDNEQLVLERLLDLSLDGDETIDAAASRISKETDLTSGTIKRLLYELAQVGILERRQVPVAGHADGRQPSMVAPNFAVRLFQHLRST
jgi:Cdc6-like AAA superfamily ATPase